MKANRDDDYIYTLKWVMIIAILLLTYYCYFHYRFLLKCDNVREKKSVNCLLHLVLS